MRGIHWLTVDSPHNGPVTGKCFYLMTSSLDCLEGLFRGILINNPLYSSNQGVHVRLSVLSVWIITTSPFWCQWFFDNTLRPRKMGNISQTFSNGFHSMKMFQFRLEYHLNLVLRVRITVFQHWLCNWLSLRRLVSWINHLRPACWSTFW